MNNPFSIRRRALLLGAGAAAIATLPACGGDDGAPAEAITRRSVPVSDGTRLNVLEAGAGNSTTLVLVPGWSQTAEQFKYQIEGLGDRYHLVAIDMRGHGDSDKPAGGYRIQRLAKDLDDVLAAMNLSKVTILGHSMGCSVLWCHFDLFGTGRIAKYVFCDQASFLTTDPSWTPQEIANYGSIFTPESVTGTANALVGADGAATTEGFLKSMVTPAMPAEQFKWIVDLNLKMPRSAAADLLYTHCHQDWREQLPRIKLPTLFIGGKASLVPPSCIAWNASQVAGSQLQIFEAAEKGSHFMFVENPVKFNEMLRAFVG
jgi:pimeloyl-ACP methyl ester carboxylesterase